MGKLQTSIARHSRQQRDSDLRAAHQRAFERIRRAGKGPDYRAEVQRAVQELIDACEAYTATDHS